MLHSRLIAASLGALVALLGVLVLVGWYAGIARLVQLSPGLVPMQYNTALGFVALGTGLWSLAAGYRNPALVLGAVPVVIGIVTLVTWVLDLEAGIDEIFFRHYITVLTTLPGRMAPSSAFCFVLAGTAVVLFALRARPTHVSIVGSLAVMTVIGGAAAGLWFLMQSLVSPTDVARFTFMAPHTGVGFVLVGAGIEALVADERPRLMAIDRVWERPVALGVGVAAIAMMLWQSFTVAEERALEQDSREAASQISTALEADGRVWAEALARTARRAARELGTDAEATWSTTARDYFNGNSWLRQIVWFNADGSVRHDVVRDPAEDLPDPARVISSPGIAREFRQSIRELDVRLVRLQTADSGLPPVLAWFVAGFQVDGNAGATVFTVRLDALFTEAIGETARGYDARIFDGAEVILAAGTGLREGRRLLPVVRTEVGAYGRRWIVEVTPGAEVLARFPTLLPQLTLLFGFTLAFLLTLALRYAGMARLRTQSIQGARALLEREVEERRRAEEYAQASEMRARRALAEMQQILDHSQDLICTFDEVGRFLVVSASARQILGYPPEALTGRYWYEFLYPADREKAAAEFRLQRAGQVTREFESRFIHRSGAIVSLNWSAAWLPEAQTSYAIGRDVTRRNRQEAMREGQREVLHLIATGAALSVTLREICLYVERMDPESTCSIQRLEEGGERIRTAAAPSLPLAYVRAIDGESIGPDAGSCGTAMWRRERIIVADIDADPLWERYRPLARQYGLKACWSIPIMGGDSRVLGSIAIYHRQICRPEPHEIEMIETATGLAAIAIEREEVQLRLVESREQFDFARRIARLAYWEVDLETGRVVLSDDLLTLLGIRRTDPPAGDDLLALIPEAERADVLAARAAALRDDVPMDLESRLVLRDGAVRYIHLRGQAVGRREGRALKLAGSVQDITARKLVELENARLYAELEDRVRERTRELEASNLELEAFSYSVSHDLRAPLRAVAGFGSLLAKEYGARLDDQGRHYLDRLIGGSVRMAALIDDLLELGRVTRLELVKQPLDLTGMAAAIAGQLRDRWPERDVVVEIEPGLAGRGDLRLIEVVLENLLDNAWKFTGGQAGARVRVGRQVRDGENVFFVADNGVGFDPRYMSRLFGVFERLHGSREFPGTGVGLATVQRILQRHGGRIWAEATVGEGATFYFTLEAPR